MMARKKILSHGSLRELTPKHWCADGRDSWECLCCGRIIYDDTKLNDDQLCEECQQCDIEE